jgi:YVTN family beta-propeller protein
MKLRLCRLLAIAAFAATCLLATAQSLAQNAYITNDGGPVSVIDTASNTVIATIPVGAWGVAVTPDGSTVYVGNRFFNTVSVIDTASNTVTATIPVGLTPEGMAVTPDGSEVYVAITAFLSDGYVAVIDTATNTVIATIGPGDFFGGVAVSPDGSTVYVSNFFPSATVSVIDTASNTVTATIGVGAGPEGVAVTPDGSKVYVANRSNTVSVIDTATNTVISTITDPSFNSPIAFGVFIQPAPPPITFAGTPGKSNCYDQSVSALAWQYRGLNAAAAALGFAGTGALQNDILAFCR